MKKNETPGSTDYMLREKNCHFLLRTASRQHKKIKDVHICNERKQNRILSPDWFKTINLSKKAHTKTTEIHFLK